MEQLEFDFGFNEDCPVRYETQSYSGYKFCLMRFRNSFFVDFYADSFRGCHRGKRRFSSDAALRLFVCNCVLNGFKVTDL